MAMWPARAGLWSRVLARPSVGSLPRLARMPFLPAHGSTPRIGLSRARSSVARTQAPKKGAEEEEASALDDRWKSFVGVLSSDQVRDLIEQEKGQDTFVLDLKGIHSGKIGDTMIVTTASNPRHVTHIADALHMAAKHAAGVEQGPNIDGEGADGWVAVDLGSVVVHVMTQHCREYYALESLWAENVRVHAQGGSTTTDEEEDAIDAIPKK